MSARERLTYTICPRASRTTPGRSDCPGRRVRRRCFSRHVSGPPLFGPAGGVSGTTVRCRGGPSEMD
jgi:hypothetical protein